MDRFPEQRVDPFRRCGPLILEAATKGQGMNEPGERERRLVCWFLGSRGQTGIQPMLHISIKCTLSRPLRPAASKITPIQEGA